MHPNQFNTSTGNGSLELWNKGNSDIIKKTIYSPSLSNYYEPKSNAFTGFSTTSDVTTTVSQFNVSGAYNKGWYFYCQPNFTGSTIFFPALGIRDATGKILYVDTIGAFYSAVPNTDSNTHCLSFSKNDINPTNSTCPRNLQQNIYSTLE